MSNLSHPVHAPARAWSVPSRRLGNVRSVPPSLAEVRMLHGRTAARAARHYARQGLVVALDHALRRAGPGLRASDASETPASRRRQDWSRRLVARSPSPRGRRNPPQTYQSLSPGSLPAMYGRAATIADHHKASRDNEPQRRKVYVLPRTAVPNRPGE